MAIWLQILLTMLASFSISGGLWFYLECRRSRNDAKTKIILGLGYDRIIALGMKCIGRGWITQEEYENLDKYIYRPYSKLRPDDGSVRLIMQRVNGLPIRRLYK